MELAAGQPYGTPTPGIRCDITTFYKVIPLTLLWITGVLTHMDFLMLTLQQAELRVLYKDPGGAPQTPPQV